MGDPYDDGYPPSGKADLDPGPTLSESLDEADREVGDEHRTRPEGRLADGSIEDEEHFDDDDQVDDPELHRHAGIGRR